MESNSSAAQSVSSGGEFYTWKFPGAPLKIRIGLGCVERLRKEVIAGAQPQQGSGREIGGLLLGEPSPPLGEVVITDFEPLPCDDSPDGRFAIATPSHVEILEQAISARRNGAAVVGFYRSHLREGLRLDDRDLTVGRIWFPEPDQVFLVIKPSAAGACDAGFFFWEGDRIQADFSFMEFPFEASLLRRIASLEADAAAGEQRAAIAGQDAPAAAAPLSPPGRKSNVLFWMLTAALLLLAGAVAAGIFLYLNGAGGGARNIASGQDAGLGLRAENRGGDLAVSWDRNSPEIRSGRSGTLFIWDGDQTRQEIPLDAGQLRSASVLYAPQTDRIQFRLEVDGERKAAESVLAILRGRARPAAAEAPSRPETPLRPPQSAPPFQTAASAPSPSNPPVREAGSQPSARPVRTFVPPAPAARNEAPVRTLYLDPPSVSSPSSMTAAAPLSSLSPGRPPGPPPPAPPEEKPAAPVQRPQEPVVAQEPKRVDVTYEPPRPLRRVPPALQSQVLRMLITGETRVEVAAQVDASGRVTGARVVSGAAHRLLISAIIDAARKWAFEPARLDGKPVSGEARIVFVLRDPRTSGSK